MKTKRLWKEFTNSIINSTNELNDSRKNLHDFALKQKNWKMSIQQFYIYSTIDHVQSCTKWQFQWHVNRQLTMYRNDYFTDIRQLSFDRNIWSIALYVTSYLFFDFVISSYQITRQERAKNKSIQHEIKTINTIIKKSKFAFKNCRLVSFFHHLFSNFQSSWMIYIACFLKNRNQRVCNCIKCARVFCAILTNAISKTLIVSYKFALRHISLRRSYLLSKRSNSKFSKFTHARESLSRKFSIHFSIHVFRFSKIFHSISICKRCQEHLVIYLSSNWFTSIASKIENNEIFMKISFLKKYWSEKVTKVICFRILLSEKILDRVNLFCFIFSLALSLI